MADITEFPIPTQVLDPADYPEFVGPQGQKGDTGAAGPQGATGPQGDAGVGVPTGGTTGQALVKKSDTNYDTEWGDGGIQINGATDIGAALADGDEIPVYDLSATANRKSAISRIWDYVAAKLSSFTGDLTAKSLSLNQNISTTAWTTNGVRVKNTSVTLTDTSSSGTVAAAYTNRWGGNTIAASNTTTFTNYATHYFDAPVAGSNVTITKSWAAIFNGAVKALFRNITEDIYYEEVTGNITIDWANGDVQYLYVNPAGSSIQITMPADPGAVSKAGILFVKNNTGKAHTWNTSPAIRFVDQADADNVPTPAAVGYYTRYTCQWNDNNGGTGSWWIAVAGRDTA